MKQVFPRFSKPTVNLPTELPFEHDDDEEDDTFSCEDCCCCFLNAALSRTDGVILLLILFPAVADITGGRKLPVEVGAVEEVEAILWCCV